MGKPWKLQIAPTNKTKSSVLRDQMIEKVSQLNEVIKWHQENKKRGWAAIHLRLFPLIKNLRTSRTYLEGIIETGKEKEYCSIFTVDEEEAVVQPIKIKER